MAQVTTELEREIVTLLHQAQPNQGPEKLLGGRFQQLTTLLRVLEKANEFKSVAEPVTSESGLRKRLLIALELATLLAAATESGADDKLVAALRPILSDARAVGAILLAIELATRGLGGNARQEQPAGDAPFGF